MNNIRRYSFPSTRYQHGLTLVEILVALVISMFLVTGVIQLFVGSKQTYRFHDALSRLQENGRLALDTMAADIRMAGFPNNPANAVIGGVNANGDTINLVWLDGGAQTRNYAIGPRTAGGTVPTCPAAGTSLRLDRNGGGLQEFIEGVQTMQILYGVCNNNGVVNPPYVNAATVGPPISPNWANVCSVRIHLLMVSLENNVVTQPQRYFFPIDTAGPPIIPNPVDRCLRQAFSTTVAIRNRIP